MYNAEFLLLLHQGLWRYRNSPLDMESQLGRDLMDPGFQILSMAFCLTRTSCLRIYGQQYYREHWLRQSNFGKIYHRRSLSCRHEPYRVEQRYGLRGVGSFVWRQQQP